MSWAEHLDRVDEVARRVRRALSTGDGLAAAAAVAQLDAAPTDLAAIPADLADRARRAHRDLAELDAAIREAMGRLEPELAALGRARQRGAPAQYVDTSA